MLFRSKQRNILLLAVWIGAVTTATLRILWLKAPRFLYVAAYILLGWAAVAFIPTFYMNGGVVVFLLIVLGGLCYTVGGIIYALKKPNFNVNWFGFHELFHTLTAAAFLFHLLGAIFTVFGLTVKGR